MRSVILLHQISFLATGVIQTLGAQWLHYIGAADKASFLTIAANYLGMVLVYYLIPSNQSLNISSDRRGSDPKPVTTPLDAVIELKSAFKGAKDSKTLKGRGETTRDTDLLPTISPTKLSPIESVSEPWSDLPLGPIFLVAMLDFFGHICTTAGLFIVGSGIFQVVYSAVVVNTAIMSRLFLRRMLHPFQWISIFTITVGLGISAVDNLEHPKLNDDGKDSMTFGLILTLIGTGFFACVYVLNESILTKYGNPSSTSPEKICATVGFFSLSFCLMYIFLYTIPNWQSLVTEPMESQGGDPLKALAVFIALILAAFLHSFNYFRLLRGIGATSTGVLTALRAIIVFSISAVVFCSVEESQCYNKYKGISTFIVCLGVIGFSYFKTK